MLAAFATKDGKFIGQHFGHTPYFCIVEIEEDTFAWKVLGKRENKPPCRFGEHDEKLFSGSIALISDCKAVFAAKVGPHAKSVLQRNGLQVLEIAGYIDEVIEGYIKYLKKQSSFRKGAGSSGE